MIYNIWYTNTEGVIVKNHSVLMLRLNIHPSQFKRLSISLCPRYVKKYINN